MKYKLILVLLIAVISVTAIPVKLSAQRAANNEAITIDPLNALLNNILFAKYERKLSPTNSFTAGALLIYKTVGGESSGTWLGFGVGGSYRWYFDMFKTRQKTIQGFSFGGRATIAYYSFSGDHNVADTDKNTTILTLGGEAQYKFIWDSFVLEPGIILDFPIFGQDDRTGWAYQPFGLSLSLGLIL